MPDRPRREPAVSERNRRDAARAAEAVALSEDLDDYFVSCDCEAPPRGVSIFRFPLSREDRAAGLVHFNGCPCDSCADNFFLTELDFILTDSDSDSDSESESE